MWCVKLSERIKSFFVSLVGIKRGSRTKLTHEKAPGLRTIFPELVRGTVTTKQNGAVEWVRSIILRMGLSSLGLRRSMSFSTYWGQDLMGAHWIGLTHLGITSRAMFVGRLSRNRPLTAYLETTGRKVDHAIST